MPSGGGTPSGPQRDRGAPEHPWQHRVGLSTQSWRTPPEQAIEGMRAEVALELGWGRVLFGQTFRDDDRLLDVLRAEAPGRRDICIYVRDPHVLVSRAPHELFVDPSYTYRLDLHRYRQRREPLRGISVHNMRDRAHAEAINEIYATNGMVSGPSDVYWENQHDLSFSYLVAEERRTGKIVGTVTGIDHRHAFGDPEDGTSLWCLAVSPHTAVPGVGEALVRALAEKYQGRGRSYLDLSVLHDNDSAIALYTKLGFSRVPVFVVKRKNPINEPLFAAPGGDDVARLNPYAGIIADEARRRGIRVEVLDAEWGELRLTHGGRTVVTRESLSELTTAVAMSRCDDKRVTRRIFAEAGLRVPRGRLATGDYADLAFVEEVGEAVVKPARGEQGQGITVGVKDQAGLDAAVRVARGVCSEVLIEELVPGLDLRLVVIDHEVVAAAVRRPATVVGTGRHTVEQLIRAQSRRSEAATAGESKIPLDETTRAVVKDGGYDLDSVLPDGASLLVRRTANLHTGGTMYDVTAELHPELSRAAVAASKAIGIPVTGLDMLVPRVDAPDYVLIEANERPGLANHEPQPTAERFLDLLFPHVQSPPRGWRPRPSQPPD